MTPHPILGLIGLPAAGKSLVARQLAELGAQVIDVDRLGHAVLRQPAERAQILAAFGPDVADAAGEIDRKKLGRIVFADPAELARLEAIVHPALRRLAEAEARRAALTAPAVLDAAVLFRLELDRICDRVLRVEAPAEIRLGRAAERGWDAAELARRDARLHQEIEGNRTRCGPVIENAGAPAELKAQVTRIWKDMQTWQPRK